MLVLVLVPMTVIVSPESSPPEPAARDTTSKSIQPSPLVIRKVDVISVAQPPAPNLTDRRPDKCVYRRDLIKYSARFGW